MPYGIPRESAGKTNPVRPTAANVSAGKRLYETSSARCHGTRGLGNGPAAPNIAATAQMPMATDSHLYWTIAEGGTPLKTAMPAFKSVLEPTQIWEIILYLRRIEALRQRIFSSATPLSAVPDTSGPTGCPVFRRGADRSRMARSWRPGRPWRSPSGLAKSAGYAPGG
jgi:Cytochrome C oxidase, cbb3-type, subunit III